MVAQSPEPSQPLWLSLIRLLRWDKPAGRLILMIPALWAVFLAAEGKPPLPLVGVIIVGSMVTSAAGCVANDFWDRDIDPQVERTRDRPLASRTLSLTTGIIVGVISLACAAVLALYLNPLSFWLCVAAVPFILFYPLAKRFFPIPQLVLSLTWGFAVLISWTAVTANLNLAAGLLWGAVVLWTLAFDTVYALSDREDDLKIGIRSSAILFGDATPDAVGLFLVGTASLLAYLGLEIDLHIGFWVAWGIAVVGWSKHYNQLKEPEIPRPLYGKIFSQNVGLGFILLAGMIVGFLL